MYGCVSAEKKGKADFLSKGMGALSAPGAAAGGPQKAAASPLWLSIMLSLHKYYLQGYQVGEGSQPNLQKALQSLQWSYLKRPYGRI
jgi:hypothetical protein